MSKGELYTIITNKYSKEKKGSLVAIFSGTKVEPIIEKLFTIPSKTRAKVKEVALDMANSMKNIVTKCFINVTQETDRFHVQKLVNEVLQDLRIQDLRIQDLRIQERWNASDIENNLILKAKKQAKQFIPMEFDNGDTAKQLLIRSRYLLTMDQSKWTSNQKQRADILFHQYPLIQQAYHLAQQLRVLYNSITAKEVGYTKLAHWYNKVEKIGLKQFNTVINTIQINYKTVLNYFDNRSTNASAESFNAKIKAFRGVRDIEFFLYRLTKLFA